MGYPRLSPLSKLQTFRAYGGLMEEMNHRTTLSMNKLSSELTTRCFSGGDMVCGAKEGPFHSM